MGIDWAALGLVFLVSVGVTAVLLTLFGVGMVTLSRSRTPTATTAAAAAVARTVAYACFATCGIAVLYGLTLVS